METWIRLYRKFDEWEWFEISEMVHLYIFLLLNANNEDGEWRGIKVKRGQILTGLHSMNQKTKISIRKLRTCLDRLKKTGEIDIQTTNKYSIITICKYDTYQYKYEASDKQTDKQPTSKRQATDNKQDIKDKQNIKEEELMARSLIFKNDVLTFKETYPPVPLLKEFYDYWTEPNKSKTKMRFEMEKTWDTKKRIETWAKRDKEFNKKSFLKVQEVQSIETVNGKELK